MKSSRLPWLLFVLVAVALLAAYGQASTPPPSSAVAAERLPYVRALAPRQNVPAAIGHPFASEAGLPADSTAAQTDPPRAVSPAPSLPPLPAWRVIGKQYDEQEGWSVFLARGEETRIVRVGDTLDETYRVASIQPPLMILQHLKRQTRQTLDIGEAKE